MNRELAEVIKLYATITPIELNECLLGKSKNTLNALLTDLLTMYINDKNSLMLREFLTVTIAGYEHTERKIGYNGYKQSSIVGGNPIMCEAKPQNINTSKGVKRKLNGGGNFTDYTFERLERDLQENLNMLVSGFIDGKFIYIIEFPFRCETFVNKLKKQLIKRFPQEEDIIGQFLRSASFYYKDCLNCKNLKVIYLLAKSKLRKYNSYIVKNFYDFLWRYASDD